MSNMISRLMKQVLEEAKLPTGTHLENMVTWRLHKSRILDKCQYRLGPYRLDYAWPDLKIGLEADGPCHWQPAMAVNDLMRDSYLRSQGWLVLRVDNESDTLELQLARVMSIINTARTFIDLPESASSYRFPKAIREMTS